MKSVIGYIGHKGYQSRSAAFDFFREISGLYYLTRATLYCTFI